MVPVEVARRRWALVGVAALLVAGCVRAGPGPRPATTPVPAPGDLAERVAAATEAAGRARFVSDTLALSGSSEAVVARSEGALDWMGRHGHRRDLANQAALGGDPKGGELELVAELWLAGDTTYERDLDRGSQVMPVSGGVGLFAGLENAPDGDGGLAGVLRYMLGGRRFTTAGTEQVRGSTATHYSSAAANDQRPLDVWVDGDTRLVRVRSSAPRPGSRVVAAATVELFDFGAPLDIPAPPELPRS